MKPAVVLFACVLAAAGLSLWIWGALSEPLEPEVFVVPESVEGSNSFVPRRGVLEAAAPLPARAEVDEAVYTKGSTWAAVIRGRVVNRQTGAGVPGLSIELDALPRMRNRAANRALDTETLTTNHAGWFETARAYGPMRTKARVKMGEARISIKGATHLHGEGAEAWSLGARLGPTLLVEVRKPDGLLTGGWSARIVELRGGMLERRDEWSSRPLFNEGEWLRLRYPRTEKGPLGNGSTILEVLSNDGVWKGTTALPESFRDRELQLQVSVARIAATVDGRVIDAGRNPLAGAKVALRSTTSDQSLTRQSRSDGRFRIAGIPPGTYSMGVVHEDESGRRGTRRPVHVLLGDQDVGDIELREGRGR